MAKSVIFRKVSLDRLSSPEQLDQLLQVTRPSGWLALAALGLILAAAVVWAFIGSVATEAIGEGILIRRGGVSDLVSIGQGQVDEVLVQVGDVIEVGQVVATIRQEELVRQIEDQRERLADLEREFAQLQDYAVAQRRLRTEGIEQRRTNLRRTLQTLRRDLEILDDRLADENVLLEQGLVTRQTILATQQEINARRDDMAASQLELDGLELTRLEEQQQVDRQLEAMQGTVLDLELDIRELEAKLTQNANVTSPQAGRVLEIVVDSGDVVAPGTSILSMEVVSDELVAVLFVPATAGKKIAPGMEARISPSTVRREEHGFLRGEVTWVSEYPSTTRGLLRLLANEDLVARLMEEGPPIQVDVALVTDAQTPSGFAWSSSSGPDLQISSGTLATGGVITQRDRPADLVIPRLRSGLGVAK